LPFLFREKPRTKLITPATKEVFVLGLKQIIIVAMGGAVGSVLRYKLGGVVLHHTQQWNFPISTLSINLFGCMVIGLLAALVEHHDLFSTSTRLLLFTGLLGGFTTFSAFGYESFFLLRRGLFTVALSYVAFSVIGGLVAVSVGYKIVDLLWPSQH
jgi:CrcB protein